MPCHSVCFAYNVNYFTLMHASWFLFVCASLTHCSVYMCNDIASLRFFALLCAPLYKYKYKSNAYVGCDWIRFSFFFCYISASFGRFWTEARPLLSHPFKNHAHNHYANIIRSLACSTFHSVHFVDSVQFCLVHAINIFYDDVLIFGREMCPFSSLHVQIERKNIKNQALKLRRNYINIEWKTTDKGAHICKLNI